MGTMDSAAATALHQAGDVVSFQLIQAVRHPSLTTSTTKVRASTSNSGSESSTREHRKSNAAAS